MMDLIDTHKASKQRITAWSEHAETLTTIAEWNELINEIQEYYNQITNTHDKNNTDSATNKNKEEPSGIDIIYVIFEAKNVQ